MDSNKAKRFTAASLAALLISVPVGILAFAISKAAKACKKPVENNEEEQTEN